MQILRRILRLNFFSVFLLCAGFNYTNAETISFADAMEEFGRACGDDLEKHCRGVPLGGGRIFQCLADNAGKLSAGCVSTYDIGVTSLNARIAAQAAVAELCEADAKRLCSNFKRGRARILRCLIRSDNVRKVTNRCNRAIDDAGWR